MELRGNQLTTTSGIQYPALVKLYLAENSITELEDLGHLKNLEVLHLRKNPLSNVSGFSENNAKLHYLSLRDCHVEDVQNLRPLSVLTSLRVLVIKNNRFNLKQPPEDAEDEEQMDEEEEDETEMRSDLLVFLPNLTRIDKKLVTAEERELARDKRAEEEGEAEEWHNQTFLSISEF